ncbi:MAG: diacylglycerol kinase family protein, partial [Candidatus Bipolaricaulis sp.]|nr:diacylglycerol kinase family protein [Candidatus Bipolaricaulis sp.]
MTLRSWIEGKRVGLIANPRAGKGDDRLDETLASLVGCLSGATIAATDGTREALAAKASGGSCELVRGGGRAGEAAERLLDAGVDVVVGVGGDGTLRDIAEAVVRRGSAARLIGIGVGSSNVGALVSAAAADAERLFDGDAGEVWVHALGVVVAGEPVGLAFHDVAFANTYFGTRAGKRIDLD